MEVIGENNDESTSDMPRTQIISDENAMLLNAKVTFRGINLWSNNIRIRDGTANFVARGNKPKKFNFNLATMLVPDDKLRVEFYTIHPKKKRKKLIAIFELILECLIDSKYIDLPEENLSDPNHYLLQSTVQLKIYYTPPDIDKQLAALGYGNTIELIDWRSVFDEEGRHGGHRYRHVHSKHDGRLTKFRTKLAGRADDADTDSYSDEDFEESQDSENKIGPVDENTKIRMQHNDLELLEKGLGRYIGDIYEVTEWQVMIHVLQGRDFPGLNINPYVSVQIDDQKRYTNIQKSSNSPYFGEFFTFDFKLPATKFMEKVIFIKVHDAVRIVSTFTDTAPIGIFRLDLATVYNEKGHAFERKWAQLSNPENIAAPCGHLLLSISVTQRGVSTRNVVSEEAHEDDEFKPSKTLVPAAMPRHLFPMQLKIIFFTATELPEMMTDFLASVSKKFLQSETWEPVDPYVEVTYDAMTATTDTRNGTTPVWGEGLYFIGRFPPLARIIKITLKDRAAVQKDRIISSLSIDVFLISESNPSAGFLPTLGPTWMFLYGSPREYTISKDKDGLSEGMGEAVCYKGRILMAIECHPVTGENTPNMNIQKETGIEFPAAHIFPMKRSFLLFGCIYDVSMIDKSFGSGKISFELSIGPSGYLNPQQLAAANHNPVSSLTRAYPCISIDNNKDYFRLPIDLQKPILFTKYIFHDYIYRMTLSNRLKYASEYLYKQIREFESKINSKMSNEILREEYKKIEHYVHTLPCGCAEETKDENFGTATIVHPSLYELLNSFQPTVKMNPLDLKRYKKILHNIQAIKTLVSKSVNFDELKPYEIVKDLNKVARAFQQMATDPQPSLPDIFLWMIYDLKRVAYARFQPEDLLFNFCKGEKGLYNGHVRTVFLKTPRSTDKPLNASTNAKVQIYLWLGIEEYEPLIFKRLPAGFDMPSLPLSPQVKSIRYNGRAYYELRCHCYKARTLIAADETGLSDPYLSITVGNETQTTPVILESLCPQWHITLVFRNLIHVGTRETAEEIIGNVVVECYDYDENGDPDLIGRFYTTAKLDLFNINNPMPKSLFKWYAFKLGEKQAGELLAVFELVEVNPETREAETTFELEEIPITTDNYPPTRYITKIVKNEIYAIPLLLIPAFKTYQIEIMFWGLRECRTINLQPIQQAEVTIECAGARITRTIKNVQKNPNFESSPTEADKYTLRVNLPDDDNFWPHLSILCVQHRLFGMKEIIGNLVVTNLQKYLEKPTHLSTSSGQAIADAVNELSKRIPFNFNRVRKSIIDAYEAALTAQGDSLARTKLVEFDSNADRDRHDSDSQAPIIHADSLEQGKTEGDESGGKLDAEKHGLKESNSTAESSNDRTHENEPLTTSEKTKRNDMEKAAGWWHKYYASKANLKLIKRCAIDMDEGLPDSCDAYAEFFEDEAAFVSRKRWNLWNRAKKIFLHVGKAQKTLRTLAAERMARLENSEKSKSAFDENLDFIETERLKELTLLQTFDIIETELENVHDYEGFNDCLDSFPIYKGKGSSRSDEVTDEKRIYTKFKGKFRIQEIPMNRTNSIHRMSINPALLYPEMKPFLQSKNDSNMSTNQLMLQLDFNKNPITLKCRLYIIKALLYRGSDRSGKADPFIKIALNNETIIDDVNGKLQNTLEPTFGKSFEFDVQLPIRSLLGIQIWDWDMTSSNDIIAETKIDIENRWLSCHRATCGLAKRYDSAGYNTWRDTKKPAIILTELCRTTNINVPIYAENFRSVSVGNETFECDPACVEFITNTKSPTDTLHRKAHHESPEEYIRQNTALAALHAWGRKINPKCALVAEHIECRSLFNPEFPEIEQGKLEMWLDFFPMSRPPSSAMTDITPPKPTSYQLRVTIWNTTDVELNDESLLTGEKTSDIYVKAWIIGEAVDAQLTDTHYRSLTGEGNFNWRFVFDFNYLDIEEKVVFEAKDSVFQVGNTTKKIPPRIIIRVYDADFFSADNFLGECIFNLTHIPIGAQVSKKCKADILLNPKQKAINLFGKKRITGWWPMIAPLKEDEIRDKTLLGGKLEAELSLITAEEAERNPVGKARAEPQPLEEPNRPKTSFLWFTSPWKTFRYIVWRNFKWAIILGIFLFIGVIFLLLAVWTLPGEIVSQIDDLYKDCNGIKLFLLDNEDVMRPTMNYIQTYMKDIGTADSNNKDETS
ncbi:unnamed protein product [Rotaria sordida]|uniref:C2 domain-containing protein n=1 Tax=Rotaria sordida TaxID=392033 RepID=A0A814EU32_9BILA|nr:unnamed protein product [Rotaria sordida]